MGPHRHHVRPPAEIPPRAPCCPCWPTPKPQSKEKMSVDAAFLMNQACGAKTKYRWRPPFLLMFSFSTGLLLDMPKEQNAVQRLGLKQNPGLWKTYVQHYQANAKMDWRCVALAWAVTSIFYHFLDVLFHKWNQILAHPFSVTTGKHTGPTNWSSAKVHWVKSKWQIQRIS